MKRSYWILVLCLLALAGAWLFWPPGSRPAPGAGTDKTSAAAAKSAVAKAAATVAPKTVKPATLNTNKLAFRLSNTTNSLKQLDRHAARDPAGERAD